jgi:hypothetical protein
MEWDFEDSLIALAAAIGAVGIALQVLALTPWPLSESDRYPAAAGSALILLGFALYVVGGIVFRVAWAAEE